MAAKAFGVSSFTSVGHLLHINLRDHLLQHKHEIGSALLRSNNRALAVVNKLQIIDNTYRNFQMEIIAKREDCPLSDEELMICEVNENQCRFRFDFSKVYWNTRLQTEHARFLDKLNQSVDIVFDLFAGVGPFSVPSAKRRVQTYANDLNPDAIEWLKFNMKWNKVKDDVYKIYNKDAKDFILEDLRQNLIDEYRRVEEQELATKPKIHILMNLPALAPTFLKHFVGLFNMDDDSRAAIQGLYNRIGLEHTIYCYCFLKGRFDDPHQQVRALIEDNFGRPLDEDQILSIGRVRNVASFKDMYRVEIRLDGKILFDTKVPVSIMKKATNTNSHYNSTNGNGTPVVKKQVTMDSSSKKRSLGDYIDREVATSADNVTKRAKVSDYCSII